MRSGYIGLGSALILSLLSASPSNAQRVSADIRIGGRGPISGHIRINPSRRDYYRDRYYRDYGYRPRQVRVEILRRYDRGRHFGWYKQFRRQPRVVVIYYDRQDDCYYDRRFYPGLEEVRVYEDDGQYYRPDDDYFDDRRYDDRRYDDRRYDDRRYDDRRYDDRRYDDRRYDDRRYDDRNGGRSDGRDRDEQDYWNRRDGRNH